MRRIGGRYLSSDGAIRRRTWQRLSSVVWWSMAMCILPGTLLHVGDGQYAVRCKIRRVRVAHEYGLL